MGIKKIAFIQLDHLVRSGKSVSEIARQLNVTKGAVSKALKRLNVAVTKDVALRAAPKKRCCSTKYGVYSPFQAGVGMIHRIRTPFVTI